MAARSQFDERARFVNSQWSEVEHDGHAPWDFQWNINQKVVYCRKVPVEGFDHTTRKKNAVETATCHSDIKLSGNLSHKITS